jgi:hypothetical protein
VVNVVTFPFSFYDDPAWRALSAYEKLVHHYLANRGYSTGSTCVSVERMVDDLGLNRKTIISATNVLHCSGFIVKDSTNRRKTVYRPVPPDGTNNSQSVPPHGTNQSVPPDGISTVSRPLSVPPDGTLSKTSKNIHSEISEKIYCLYPAKDKNNKHRSTGKSHTRDIKKITALLKAKEPVQEKIESYLSECSKTKTYLKNFGTLLNNLPDITQPECNPEKEMIAPAPMFEQNPFARIRREYQEAVARGEVVEDE